MPVQIPIFGGGQIVGGQGSKPLTADWGPKDMSAQLQQGIANLYKLYQDSENEAYGKSKRREAGEVWQQGANAASLGQPGGPYARPEVPSTGPYNTGGRVPSFAALPNKGVSADFKPLFENGEQQYALPPGTLGTLAFLESGFKPGAKNPGSSAGGLFQFIDKTAKQYGLTDRYDPVAATDAAGRLAQDNARQLQQVLGRMPTVGEIYLAHQQGGTGAARLLTNPNARAVDIVGEAAVRKNGGRVDMTAGEFAGLWTNKASAAHKGLYGGQQPSPQAAPAVAPGPGGNQPVLNANGQQMTYEEQVEENRRRGLPPPVMPSAANPNPQANPQAQPQPNPTPATGSSQPLFPAPGNTPVPPNQAQGPQPQPYQVAGPMMAPPQQSAQTLAPGGPGGSVAPGGPGMQMPPGTNDAPPPVTQGGAPAFVPGGPAPGPGIGVNPDGSRDTTGPNGETISANPPPGRQPPPAATEAPATTPPVQTAGGGPGAGISPALLQAGNRLGISPDAMSAASPYMMKALGLAIQAGDPSMVQAIAGGINAITAQGTAKAAAQGTQAIVVQPDDTALRQRFNLKDDGRAYEIKLDAYNRPTDIKPIADPRRDEDKTFTQEQQLAKDVEGSTEWKTYQAGLQGLGGLRAAFAQGDPTGDIAAIFQYMKSLDPTSTVSAGEQATAANAGSIPNSVWALYNQARGSGKVTPELRRQFYNTASAVTQAKGAQAERIVTQKRNIAEAYKLNPDRVGKFNPFPHKELGRVDKNEKGEEPFRDSVDKPGEVYGSSAKLPLAAPTTRGAKGELVLDADEIGKNEGFWGKWILLPNGEPYQVPDPRAKQ